MKVDAPSRRARSLARAMPLMATVCALLFASSVAAHGHRHHGYDRGYGSVHLGLSFGSRQHNHRSHRHYRSSRHHYRHSGRHRGSSVFFSYSAPLYVAPRYVVPRYVAPRYYAPAPVVVYEHVRAAPRLPDMPTLSYAPTRGQDEAQTTADRQACESGAWRASRATSGTTPGVPEPERLRHELTACMQDRGYAVG